MKLYAISLLLIDFITNGYFAVSNESYFIHFFVLIDDDRMLVFLSGLQLQDKGNHESPVRLVEPCVSFEFKTLTLENIFKFLILSQDKEWSESR